MELSRNIKLTLWLQTIGVIAMVLVNVIVSQRYGPEGQGYLSHYRSTVLFIVQIGLVGLPQSLVYMLNTQSASRQWAIRFSTFYFLFFCLAGAAVWSLSHWFAGQSFLGFGYIATIAMVIAAAGSLLHELYRAISLATKSALVFNLITIIPPVISLAVFSVWYASDFHVLVWVLVIASIAAVIITAIVLGLNPLSAGKQKKRDDSESHNSISKIRFSFTFGFFSCFPAIVFHLVAVVTYAFLRVNGDESAGQFSIALLVLTFVLLPLERVMPLLFDAWSKKSNGNDRRESYVVLAHIGSLLAVSSALISLFVLGPVIHLVFGDRFLPAVLPTQILVFSIYAFYQSRLQSSLLLSLGQPRIITLGAIVRGATILIMLYLGQVDSALSAAVAWAVGECISLVILSIYICRATQWSILEVHGISPKWFSKLTQRFVGSAT